MVYIVMVCFKFFRFKDFRFSAKSTTDLFLLPQPNNINYNIQPNKWNQGRMIDMYCEIGKILLVFFWNYKKITITYVDVNFLFTSYLPNVAWRF